MKTDTLPQSANNKEVQAENRRVTQFFLVVAGLSGIHPHR